MRGMGQSEAPDEPEAYHGVDEITADLIGLLDHCGIERAIFVGIDFGAFAIQDTWHCAAGTGAGDYLPGKPAAPHNPG